MSKLFMKMYCAWIVGWAVGIWLATCDPPLWGTVLVYAVCIAIMIVVCAQTDHGDKDKHA